MREKGVEIPVRSRNLMSFGGRLLMFLLALLRPASRSRSAS